MRFIHASCVINSPAHVVAELILNSVDAGATCISVNFDMDSMDLNVIDNGSGIESDDLLICASQPGVSRIASLPDLSRSPFYGYRGEMLWAMGSVANVEIITKVAHEIYPRAKSVRGGKTIFSGIELFWNQRARREKMEKIGGKVIAGILLNIVRNSWISFPQISISFQGKPLNGEAIIFHSPKEDTDSGIFGQFFGRETTKLMKCVNYIGKFREVYSSSSSSSSIPLNYNPGITHRNKFIIQGLISKRGIGNKSRNLQFLFVNGRFIRESPFHKELNLLLISHTPIKQEISKSQSENETRIKDNKTNGGKHEIRCADAPRVYPFFILRIEVPPSFASFEFEDDCFNVHLIDWRKREIGWMIMKRKMNMEVG
ncbi:MAG: putative DNA mismatch repair protein MutL [Streblomastix strix]|uniref:Putative DNA mismatch repair protein MutL n=1 Tax=Streblomastix strix TaxID=222440 RepID=A0A5J4UV46_9EUKA|nr:MAG: putative DNA mismatch repair protein MutL [Streblomastix strix]